MTAHATTPPTIDRLSRTVHANGWFSLISGLVLMAAALPVARLAEMPTWVVAITGAGLVPYGIALIAAARRHPFAVAAAQVATAGDALWVVVAGVLIAVPNTMSGGGKALLGALSVIVAGFGAVQLAALLNLRRGQ